MKKFTQGFIGLFALVFTMSFSINAQTPGTPSGGDIEITGCTNS